MAYDDWWDEDDEADGPVAGGQRAAAAAPARRGRQRRRATAGAALAAMLLGFFAAGLLDAAALRRDVETMPLGARRTALLWLIRPMTALSGAVGLDEPAQALDRALSREGGRHHARGELVRDDARPIWPRDVTADKPLRLYIAGDSMAGQFGRPLAALAEQTSPIETRVDYHVSSGLSRPEYFDWPQRLIDMVVESRAEAVVFLVGGNDAQDVRWEDKVLHVGSRAWLDLYRLRVAEAMEIATAGGRRVYWVGQPIMKDDTYGERMAMLNRVYEEVAATHDGVTYVDSWALFADENGEYAAYLRDGDGERVRMRQADGIHLTRAGADRLSARVLQVVRRDWGIDGEPQ
jgi:hypothetical protein